MLKKYDLLNLDCAACAAKIESRLKAHAAVRSVVVDFATLTLHIDTDDIETVRREINVIEPEVSITPRGRQKVVSREDRVDFKPGKEIITFAAALLLFLIQLLFEERLHRIPFCEIAVALTAYLLAGWNVLAAAFRTIRKGQLFDENVLMTIATAGAFAIHAVSEAVGVMLFYKVGEFLQELAVSRSRRSIKALLAIRPDSASLKTETGIERVPPEQVVPGQIIVIKAGEKIPLDGIIKEGSSLVDTAALTGEPVPVTVNPGDTVLAGALNTTAMLTVRVSKPYGESSIARIIDLVENATAKKAKTERFITQFARYYTPAVVFLSACLAFLPPVLVPGQPFETWIYRALVLLVISCPCALVISIPLGYFGGIGGASRRGILVKGSAFIDALASVKTVVFDKTGTLTKGIFKVKKIATLNGFSNEQLLKFAAIAESNSNHPIAKSLIEAAGDLSLSSNEPILEHHEISGYGVKVTTAAHTIIAGNDALMHREKISHDLCDIAETVVHVAVDGTYAGFITIGDELKEDAPDAILKLRRAGVSTVTMLTGDNHAAAKIVADALHLDAFHAGLLPEDKVRLFETICSENKKKGKIAFVGDGINDSPVLARADVGIAMGALGSDAAIETADVVLMTDHPSKAADAILIGKRTRAIVWQNIVLALSVKAVFIGFGAIGLAGMWEAVFADVGTALLAVLNSTRALKPAVTMSFRE